MNGDSCEFSERPIEKVCFANRLGSRNQKVPSFCPVGRIGRLSGRDHRSNHTKVAVRLVGLRQDWSNFVCVAIMVRTHTHKTTPPKRVQITTAAPADPHTQNVMSEGTRRLATIPKELPHYRELSCRRNRKKQNSKND